MKKEEILDLCWQKLARGLPIEEILKEYPQFREEIEELITIAREIKQIPKPPFPPSALDTCLLKVGRALQEQKQKYKTSNKWLPPLKNILNPLPVKLILTSFIIIIFFWGSLRLSADTLPGNLLYPLKRLTEKIKVLLVTTAEDKIELHLIYSDKRMQELINYIQEKGELEPKLLEEIISELILALKNTNNLDSPSKKVYLSRIKYMNAHHREMFEEISKKIPPSQKEMVLKAMRMCNMRMHNMGMNSMPMMP